MDRPQQHVGEAHHPPQVEVVGNHGGHGAAKAILQPLQGAQVVVEHDHAGAQAQEGFGSIGADHARAEDDHIRRRHARDPAEQDALAAGIVLQVVGRDLGGHAPADLAEGVHHRVAAVLLPDHLVGDHGQALVLHGL